MTYVWIGCCIGSAVAAYFVGWDRGYREAHGKIVRSQLPRVEKCDRPKCQKTGGCNTEEAKAARKMRKKLRVVKSGPDSGTKD